MKKIFVLFSFLILFFVSCTENNPTSTSRNIEYRVTGTASSVSLTYENSSGGTEQIDSVSLPWQYSFTVEVGAFLYISAQNNGSSGTVTSTIYVDGSQYKTSTSSGAYVIASASGIAE